VPADDGAYMRRALDLARNGWGHTAPNPMVGAVVVRDGAIVGEGHHASYGGDHAEVRALTAAGSQARGATVYVTLEPCAHVGRTPPCVDALIRAQVGRVVVATRDPHPIARGGIDRLAAAGIATSVGIEERAARELNAAFFHALESDRPWVTLKMAVSIDAAVADPATPSGRLTGDLARAEVHRLRAGHDAIAVGIGTVRVDDPLLTVRYADAPRVPPTRIVFDRHATLALDSQLVRTAHQAPVVVVTATVPAARRAALTAAGVEVMEAAAIGEALRALRARAIRSVLLEGGPRLAGAFLTASAVDRLVIFQAPFILGARALPAFAFAPEATLTTARRLEIVERRSMGGDAMTVYAFSST
jgi:diaminohydroxyphosphoribosylaminopyrimidine deaminase/5-amino-6-(5-phosphoribosylamino)uracil reductase